MLARVPRIIVTLLTLLACWTGQLLAQPGIVITSDEPQYLTPCGPSGTFQCKITNQDVFVLANAPLFLQLPEGIEYVPGSLSASSVLETDLSDLNAPQFTVQIVQAGGSLNVTFALRANCSVLDNSQANQNQFELVVNQDTIFYTSSPYNINLPTITAIGATNFDYQGAVGEIYTRSVGLINAGFGPITELYIRDEFSGGGAVLLNAGPGTFQMVADTAFIHLGPDDFMQVGDGDGLLEQGEVILLQEELEILSCAPSNSFMTIGWGCEGERCQSVYLDGQVSILTDLPVLTWTFGSTNYPSFCAPGLIEVKLTNNGNGGAAGIAGAYDLTLEAGWGVPGVGIPPRKDSCLTLSNFQIGGTTVVVDSSFSGFGLAFNQFTTDPDGPGGLSDLDGDGQFDDLAQGDTIQLFIETGTDSLCFYGDCLVGLELTTFKLRHQFQNQCGLTFTNQVVNDSYGLNISPGHEIDNLGVDYDGGELVDLQFIFERVINQFDCTQDETIYHFILPPTLAFSDQLLPSFAGAPVPYSINGDTISFTADHYSGELFFQVLTICDTINTVPNPNTQPCGSATSVPTVSQIKFWVDYYCQPDCDVPVQLYCGATDPFLVKCGTEESDPPEGVSAGPFLVNRSTLGWTDSTLVNLIDPATTNIQSDYVLPFDTVRFDITGKVFGVNTYDTTSFYFYYFNGSLDPTFTYLFDTLSFYDFEADLWHHCPNIGPTLEVNADGVHLMQFDMLPLLQPGACLEGLDLSAEDLIYYKLYALVNNFENSGIEKVESLQAGFSFAFDGDTLTCNEVDADLYLVDPGFELGLEIETSNFSCDTILFSTKLVQGINHIGAADPFPFEYRPYTLFDTIRYFLPEGLAYVPGSAEVIYPTRVNNTPNGPLIEVIYPMPDPQIIPGPGPGETTLGFLEPADFPVVDLLGKDTEKRLQFMVFPECMADGGFSLDADVNIRGFYYSGAYNVVFDRELDFALDYQLGDRTVEIADPSFEGFSDTAVWVLEYCNTSFSGLQPLGIPNNFIYLDLANNSIQPIALLDITDTNNPISYPLMPYGTGNSFWAQIDTLSGNTCRIFQLSATYSACELIEFPITFDFNCGAYPLAPDQVATVCDSAGLTRTLRVIPSEAGLQINLTDSPSGFIDLCSPLDYSLTVINTLLGNAFDVEVDIALPPNAGLFLIPGSCTIEYGNSGPIPIPDPQAGPGAGEFFWDLAALLPDLLAAGLPGVSQPEPSSFVIHFQLSTDCNYINKSIFSYQVRWRNACESLGGSPTFFSPPFKVVGVPSSFNDYVVSVQGPPLVNCGAASTYAVSLFNLGDSVTNALELIRILVDPALDFVPGSFQNVLNFPGGGDPVSYMLGNERRIEWQMPAGIPIGQYINFEFDLSVVEWDSLFCADTPLHLQVLRQAEVACQSAPTGFCDLDILEAEGIFNFPVEAAEWSIDLLNGTSIPLNADEEQVTFELMLQHLSGPAGAGTITLDFYADINGNQSFDPNEDFWLGNNSLDMEGALPGSSQTVSIDVIVPILYSCSGYLAVIDLGNNSCTCSAAESYLPYVPLFNAGQADSVCFGTPLIIGSDPVSAYSYQWTPATYLDDPSQAQPVFQYTGTFPNDIPVTELLVLETTRIGGCLSYDTLAITTLYLEAQATPLAQYNGFGVSCPGATDGSVQVLLNGGMSPFTFNWSNGGQEQQQTNLPAGTFSISVQDAMGCESVTSLELIEPPALNTAFAASDYSGFGVSCFNAADGSLEAFPTGGVGGYNFAWSGGSTANPLTELPAGTYQLSLTDANGCERVDTLSLNQPTELLLTAAPSPILCTDGTNGSITLQATGGVGPYVFEGTSFADSFNLAGLSNPGVYTLSILDANECPASVTANLEQWISNFQLSSSPVLCPSGNEGSLCVQLVDGFGPFDYEWSQPGQDNCLTDLSAGDYAVTVTDGNGCIYTFTSELTALEPFALSFTTEPVSCFGGNDGSLSVTASGGTLPYVFQWEGGQQGDNLAQLAAGWYSLTLTDGAGCTWTDQVELTQPDPLSLDLSAVDATCFEGMDGQLSAVPQGGTAPYFFNWNTGSSDATIDLLSVGTYTLTLTDSEGCTTIASGTVGQAPFPLLDLFTVDASCFGFKDGSLQVDFPVGPDYAYSLDGQSFQSFPEFFGLGVGAYTVYLEDPDGCIYTYPASINEPPEDLVETSPDTTILLGETTELIAYGYPGVVNYVWEPPLGLDCPDCSETLAGPFSTTTYSVTVVTADGCEDSDRVTVQVRIEDDVYIPNGFSPNLDGNNDYFMLFAGPSVVQVDYMRVYDRWGGLVFEADHFLPNDPAYGWDGRIGEQQADTGVFVYVVQVSYIDGSRRTFKGDVTLIR